MLIEGLELDDFSKIYEDYTKEQIIEVFNELEQMAKDFEVEMDSPENKRRESFLISIIWIGFSIYPGFAHLEELVKKRGIEISELDNETESNYLPSY